MPDGSMSLRRINVLAVRQLLLRLCVLLLKPLTGVRRLDFNAGNVVRNLKRILDDVLRR